MTLELRRTLSRGGRAVVVTWLLLSPLEATAAQPRSGPAQNALAGAQVFGAKGCSNCHAINGLGGTVGPDLGRLPRPRSFYDLGASMWNHLPRMAERMRELGIERPRLDPRQTADLIAFLFTLDYFDEPGDPVLGKQLFARKNCVRCHQVAGVGGVVGPNLDFLSQYGSPIFVAAAMWNHGPAMAEAMRARGIERPTFSGSELIDLIAYLESAAPEPPGGLLYVLPGRAEQGRDLFARKRCIECHGVRGRGGQIGPDLADRAVTRSLTEFAAAMWNKAPAMLEAMRARRISVPELSAGEMADLVGYLYSVQYFEEAGDARRGRDRLRDRGCLECHSLRGRGGRTAGDLAKLRRLDSPAAVITALWNHLLLVEDAGVRETSWPLLRPAETADIASFLQTREAERP